MVVPLPISDPFGHLSWLLLLLSILRSLYARTIETLLWHPISLASPLFLSLLYIVMEDKPRPWLQRKGTDNRRETKKKQKPGEKAPQLNVTSQATDIDSVCSWPRILLHPFHTQNSFLFHVFFFFPLFISVLHPPAIWSSKAVVVLCRQRERETIGRCCCYTPVHKLKRTDR